MKDSSKTKDQLIEELTELRSKLSELGNLESERERVEDETYRHHQIQHVISDILETSLKPFSLKEILEYSLKAILSFPFYSILNKGSIFLVGDSGDTLRLEVQQGLLEPQQEMCATVPFGRCVCGRAASSREIIYIDHVNEEHENRYEGMAPHGHYCVPIICRDQLLGVINTYIPEGHKRLPAEDDFFEILADTLAGIIIHKQTEEKFMQSEERFRNLTEVSSDWVWEVDEEAVYTYVSPIVESLLGYTTEEMLGNKPFDFMPPYEAERIATIFGPIVEKREPFACLENTNFHKDGHPVVLESSGVPIFDGDSSFRGYRGIDRDITDRKNAEDELRKAKDELEVRVEERTAELSSEIKERMAAEVRVRDSRRKLRKLASHIQFVQEEERALIARDIHDELGQTLTALHFEFSFMSTKQLPDIDFFSDKSKRVSALVNDAIETIQRISSELHPRILDDLGLTAAIEWYVRQFQERTGVECKLIFDPKEIDEDKELNIAVYRAVQESLTNVARHAEATKVSICLCKEEENLVLEIFDNGKGVTNEEVHSSTSFGLLGIKERFIHFGGKVKVEGIEGEGTTVMIVVPVGDSIK